MKIFHEKSLLSQDMRMTKDVRSEDGWRIIVRITDSGVHISHVRKEQSLVKSNSQSWEVCWRLNIFLTADINSVVKASIEILDLKVGDNFSSDEKAELQRLYPIGIFDSESLEELSTEPFAIPLPITAPKVSESVSCGCILS
jgi:hypothetical protein